MAEATRITFTYQEIAESLVKKQGIHEGLWGIFINFGLTAANLGISGTDTVMPTAIVPVQEIGIQKFDKPNSLTVDASVVNPKPTRKQGKK